MRQKTWKVLEWPLKKGEEDREGIEHECICGRVAWIPTAGHPGVLLIAQWSRSGVLRLVVEPPDKPPRAGWLPAVIKCRGCKRVFSDEAEVA